MGREEDVPDVQVAFEGRISVRCSPPQGGADQKALDLVGSGRVQALDAPAPPLIYPCIGEDRDVHGTPRGTWAACTSCLTPPGALYASAALHVPPVGGPIRWVHLPRDPLQPPWGPYDVVDRGQPPLLRARCPPWGLYGNQIRARSRSISPWIARVGALRARKRGIGAGREHTWGAASHPVGSRMARR